MRTSYNTNKWQKNQRSTIATKTKQNNMIQLKRNAKHQQQQQQQT